jgi:hypothetical protein
MSAETGMLKIGDRDPRRNGLSSVLLSALLPQTMLLAEGRSALAGS